jgi:histidinol-phosphate aminotransferase
MSISRRRFVTTMGAGALFISARGHEAWASAVFEGRTTEPFSRWQTSQINLSSNENPLGPGQHVLDAMRDIIGPEGAGAARYMFAQQNETIAAIARAHGVAEENIRIGAGSSEILRVAAEVFTAADRPIVSPNPTFESAASYVALLGREVRRVPLDGDYRSDLDAMIDASEGAGLVIHCNPNNPTATVHSAASTRDFIDRVHMRSPETMILVDEAYHHYVTDPDYESAISIASEDPRVVVARTFSKAYGMAGLRVGFAVGHPETIARLTEWRGMDMSTNVPARVGVVATLERGDGPIAEEQARNTAVRAFTRKFFHDAGYEDTDSQANFILVDIRQSATDFRSACSERGVRIGAGSPLYPNHARITMGTQAEMDRAVEVFASVLG